MSIPPPFLSILCALFLSRVFMQYREYQPIIMLSWIASKQSMKHWVFYSPDIHDGTRRDLAMSLYRMNQSIVFSSKKCSLPKYSIVHFLENKVDDKVPRETHDTPINPRMTPAFSRSYSVKW